MIIKPMIHLNGTSAAQLAEPLAAATTALRATLEALAACAPNGRDYYHTPGAVEVALAEHVVRLQAVHGVLAEILELREHVYEHTPRRSK